MRGLNLTFDQSFNSISNKDRTNLFRQSLLKLIEQNKQLYNAYNFRDFGFPDVIYQKPFNNKTNIFFKKNSKASKLYSKLLAYLFKNPIVINEIEYKLQDFSQIREVTIMPSKHTSEIHYSCITPLLLFAHPKKYPMFYTLQKKYEHNKPLMKEKLQEMAKSLMISNLKWQVQQLVKYRKLDMFDNIDIKWENFDVKFISYHKGELKTPAIFGSFTSSYELPRFIGEKIGKGFGQINKKYLMEVF